MSFYGQEDIVLLGQAYTRAWECFLKKGHLTPQNLDRARLLLARVLFDLLATGERDEWRLARRACAELCARELPEGQVPGSGACETMQITG